MPEVLEGRKGTRWRSSLETKLSACPFFGTKLPACGRTLRHKRTWKSLANNFERRSKLWWPQYWTERHRLGLRSTLQPREVSAKNYRMSYCDWPQQHTQQPASPHFATRSRKFHETISSFYSKAAQLCCRCERMGLPCCEWKSVERSI